MDELREAWERDGYVVLRGAAPDGATAAYTQDLDRLRDGLLVRAPGDEHVSLAAQRPGGGAVDPYALSGAARDLLLAPAVLAFLAAAVYDDTPPLLFDAAEAAAGAPDDGPYRDATYTALATEPERLVTLAVALGDAALAAYPGTHTVATTPFSGRYRHVNPERDGDDALRRHRDELAAALAGREPAELALAAGDAVLWAADLVHAPVTGAALVAHLAPCTVKPGWFAYRPERARHAAHADGAAWVTSQHYDLVDAVAPEDAPAGVQDAEEIERVERALRAHDQELAAEPTPNPATPAPEGDDAAGQRRGGLLDSVRGIMGRRGRGR
jgi:hypothetical protein